MINYITTASKQFFQHQIGTTCAIDEIVPQESAYVAYIDITNLANAVYRVYIAMDEPILAHITELFLGEDTPDEQTLQEMLLETTNMVVGSAKVLAEESESAFNIKTPFIETSALSMVSYDNKQTLKIDNSAMIIALKEL